MSEDRVIVVDQPWLEVGCTLGEGPLYDPTTTILHFVDIPEKKVFHVNTETLEVTVDAYEDSVTCLALRRGGGLACATARGFGLLGDSGSLEYLAEPISPEDQPYTRFNDGACDSQGRFFAGTIYSPQHQIAGKLYRYDPVASTCDVLDEGPFTDSNGLGWSPDDKTFYFTDSMVNKIYAYDHDAETGLLENRRVFVDAIAIGFSEDSFCDGLCVDDAGGVWSARWGGSRVVRFTENGEVDFQIIFTTALNVTSCCFGGPEDDQLFVTSAHCKANGGDEARQTAFPDSGHVFCVDLSGKFRGVPRHQFAG